MPNVQLDIDPALALRAARLARQAGMSEDQLSNFWIAGYQPFPKQMLFHAACREADLPGGPTDIGWGGARGGGKSKSTFSQLSLDDCQRQPELKCLFLRKVGKAARESFEDLRRQTLRGLPHDYRAHLGKLDFPNGSTIILGHFKTEKDIDSYLGIEYDVIAIEEATQLTPEKKRDIRTCLRTSKPDWRPRTYQTTNPGGIDHEGFKQQFVEPFRKNEETRTRFIPATVEDNPAVNREYRRMLEDLVGWKRRAWLYGDWDIAAGQYFSNWRRDRIVAPAFSIPDHWQTWACLDYGFTHPTAVYLLAENDGMVYVVDEFVQAKALPVTNAESIHAMLGRNNRRIADLWTFVAGADVFAQKGDASAKTIAQQYESFGIKLTQAPMDRVSGWSEMLALFGDEEHGIAPRITIFDRCAKLIETIPRLQHDPNRPEDVLKDDIDEDGSGGDDAADSLRYGLMARLKRKAKPGRSYSHSIFTGR